MSDHVACFLNINKPSGMTSHDVVAQVRRWLRRTTGSRKVGHAGTLDPSATGVLVICVGHATRLSEYVMQGHKQYRATVRLGIETDTYDADGTITAEHDPTGVTLPQVVDALESFRGQFKQIPPMVSAIKVGGKRLYELAREGKHIEREARPVAIHNSELVDWKTPHFTIDVTCSPGTYIRSLAHDIGQITGVGAHLASLQRTRSGIFRIEEAVALEDLVKSSDWHQHCITPQQALADWAALTLSSEQAEDVKHGRFIVNDGRFNEQLVMAFTPDGYLLAVLEHRGDRWKPHKVFPIV